MSKMYFYKPKGYHVLPFLILITKKYYQMIWAKELIGSYSYTYFTTAKFNQQHELEEYYSINENDNSKQSRNKEYWIFPVFNEILNNINEAKEVNPKQFLTHENKYLRDILKESLKKD